MRNLQRNPRRVSSIVGQSIRARAAVPARVQPAAKVAADSAACRDPLYVIVARMFRGSLD